MKRSSDYRQFSRAVLDQDLSRGAIKEFIKAGYLAPKENRVLVDDRYLDSILTAPLSVEALIYITLFDEVTLLMRDRERLFPEIRQLAPGIEFEAAHPTDISNWTNDALKAKAIIVADFLIREENPRSRLQRIDPGLLFSDEDMRDLKLLRNLIYAKVGDRAQKTPFLFEYIDKAVSDRGYIDTLAKTFARESKVITQSAMHIYFRSVMLVVRDQLDSLRDLLKFSTDKDAVAILADSLSFPSSDSSGPPKRTDTRDEVLVTVQAFINEMIHLPWPANVDEALDIREAKDIRALRKQLCRWSDTIRDGDRNAEEEIRRSIAAASDRIRTAGRCRVVGGWTAYASLPVATVEAMLGLPPIAGFTLATVGAATQGISDALTWRNRWMAWETRWTGKDTRGSAPR
jgi:hypothetical protein